MTMIRKLIQADISALGEDEVEVVMSTAALARDGHVLVPQGVVLDNYRKNPIVLWSHDPDKPVANAEEMEVGQDQIAARVKFAPLGISSKADEVRGLTKAKVIRAVSVGFDPIEMEPLDPKRPKGGQRITKWELLELSFVSVPADPGAVVTARSLGDDDMADSKAAPAVVTETITGERGVVARMRTTRTRKVIFSRGLYQVAQLAYTFESLGCQVDNAKWEAAIEGDASKVPAMLAAVLSDLGGALIAMTAEEVAEALAGHDVEGEEEADDDEALVVEERQHIAAAASPAIRAFRRGLAHAKLRAGKSLSAETVRCLREAKAAHEEATALHRSGLRKSKEAVDAIDEMMDRAGVSDSDSDATQTVQKSDGTQVDEGSRLVPEGILLVRGKALIGDQVDALSADFRRRQAELMQFAAVA